MESGVWSGVTDQRDVEAAYNAFETTLLRSIGACTKVYKQPKPDCLPKEEYITES